LKEEIIVYFSKIFVPTTREDPSDADLISHKQMIKSGVFPSIVVNTVQADRARPSCCQLYVASFFTTNKNKIDHSWSGQRFCCLFPVRSCLSTWEYSEITLCAGWLGASSVNLSFQRLSSGTR